MASEQKLFPKVEQEVKTINITELVLWTENPRDPINKDAKDQDVVDMALDDHRSKWTLAKLAKEMGDYYDFSELPTVVYHDGKPIVYDGNRRIILGKIKKGLVSIGKSETIGLPNFPDEIPCNVCVEKIALQNVFRKHSDSGSWQPLERDIFLHKFMGREKSAFLILEEDTGIITANPHLNQRFVKEEIFKEDALNSMGFGITNGRLYSVHNDQEGYQILSDISQKVEKKQISTRNNRGKVIEVLDPSLQQLIDQNKAKTSHISGIKFNNSPSNSDQRQSRRIQKKATELFGGKLYLKIGDVSDLYRDIMDLYKFYLDNKDTLSHSFPCLIRMSLRLICEAAQKDAGKSKLDEYLKEHFTEAKKTLNQDIRTTLANNNVTETSITQLLHTGAHTYQASSNLEQTIAVSIIVGAILTITHGKEENR